ncbi:MAG: hypothetical protein Q7P63_07115 [Verrucomicrobiota bacterium JB022]|nr:hypothetical protein [Verrucomicrobiota bacterium JB022]
MYLNKTTSLVASLMLGATALQAQIVALYDFTSRSAASSVESALGTASDMAKSFGVNFAGSVSNSTFDYYDRSNSPLPDSLAGALAAPRYVTFDFTPAEALDFTSFTFDLGIYNYTGSAYSVGAFLFSSATGFDSIEASLGGGTFDASAGSGITYTNISVDLTGFEALREAEDTITFRLYYYDTAGISSSEAMVRLDNLALSAAPAAAVPEPATLAFLAGASSLFFAFYRQRKA